MGLPSSFFGWVAFLAEKYAMVFLKGAGVSVYLAVVGTVLGTLIGLGIGIVLTVPDDLNGSFLKRGLLRLTKEIMHFYVWFFRGTPMMVQAMLIFYAPAQLWGIRMDPIAAGLIVLSINTGAYMAETVRGGILSVGNGQMEGAKALGLSHLRTMLLITLPQAFRNIMPQIGNNLVSSIKDSSVLSVITVNELFYASRAAAGVYFKFFEIFFITCLIYLVLTSLASHLIGWVEKRMDGPKSYELVEEAAIDHAIAGDLSAIARP